MLTRIDVNSESSFSVKIAGATTKDSLRVQKITGLDPPDLTLFVGDYARDGGSFQGRRVGVRNVVITMDLDPNPALGETVSKLREKLYKAFIDPNVDSDDLRIGLILSDGRVLEVVGNVEKFETEIFSDVAQAQISILCPDPYIRDQTEIILQTPTGWLSVPFEYHGTAETGFETEIYVNGTTATLILDNNSGATGSVLSTDPTYLRGRMVMNANLVAGDVVYVNTVRGQRDILKASASSITPTMQAMTATDRWAALEAANLTTPMLNSLSATSPWLALHSQSNLLRIYGATPNDTVANMRQLEYRQAYWGI